MESIKGGLRIYPNHGDRPFQVAPVLLDAIKDLGVLQHRHCAIVVFPLIHIDLHVLDGSVKRPIRL